mmetsp:Transcript_4334/g.14194  ORF Transcript_4334/g.14194 Transcript_4334/m.14194 type:complete len:221 (+) Transcript_4334:1291-1953(+)
MTLATLLLSICVFEYRCVQIELSVRKVVLFPTKRSKPTVGALFIRITAECPSISFPFKSSKSLCELPTTAHVLKSRLYLGASFSISLACFAPVFATLYNARPKLCGMPYMDGNDSSDAISRRKTSAFFIIKSFKFASRLMSSARFRSCSSHLLSADAPADAAARISFNAFSYASAVTLSSSLPMLKSSRACANAPSKSVDLSIVDMRKSSISASPVISSL